MTRPQDVFGAAPKSVLNKPFMHVQDQKPTGASGGDSVAGDNQRDLSTVLTNEIQGASLNTTTGEITLPTGEYWVEAISTLHASASANVGVKNTLKVNGADIAFGVNGSSSTTYAGNFVGSVSKKFSLIGNSVLTVNSVAALGRATDGLGVATDRGEVEVYTDLRIWKLDSQIRTPVANNGGIYPVPANTYVTGNMFGLDYAKTGDHTIQVQPGVCFDALNSTLLTGALQTVIIPSAINTIYTLFLCNDGLVRTDTDVDGVNLSGTYQIRWIGFVTNDASGLILPFAMLDGVIRMSYGTAWAFASPTISISYTQYSMSSLVPTSRCSVEIGAVENTETTIFITSIDGVSGRTEVRSLGDRFQSTTYFKEGWYIRSLSTGYDNGYASIAKVKLIR